MKSLLICVFCVITLTLTGCGCDGNTTKTVSQLTESEKGALDSLMQKIYSDAGAQFFYTTTYYSLPSENGTTRQELDKPIVLISAACVGSHMLEESTLTAIKNAMYNKAVSWNGSDGKVHELSILEGYLVQNPGGAGGSMYTSNDMVTIVPTKIVVTEK